jgi:hypothetical protein
MLKTWEDARTEGSIKTRAEDILTVLSTRGINVPAAARKRILAQKDPKQLTHWLKKAVVTASVDDLFKSQS